MSTRSPQRRRKKEIRATPEFLRAIGRNVQRYRRLREYKQRELDHIAGLSEGYTSELERGNRNPTAATLEVIASALQVTESELVRRPGSTS